MSMTSSRPYMIRALYQWIVDNNSTPYLLVDAHGQGVSVPQEYVNKEGQIVLNISPSAVKDLQVQNDCVSFSARFGGIPMEIYVPCVSILGIYARENGQGMIFEPEIDGPLPPGGGDSKAGPRRPPSLRVVK